MSVQAAVPPVYDQWISDGTFIYMVNTTARSYTRSPVPAFVFDLGVLDPPQDDSVPSRSMHPFSMLIPSAVPQYLYPHWFAQQINGEYTLQGTEEWLERPVWVVAYESPDGTSRAWIDQATGVILRFVQEGYVNFEITSMVFDQPVDASLFSVPAEFTQE